MDVLTFGEDMKDLQRVEINHVKDIDLINGDGFQNILIRVGDTSQNKRNTQLINEEIARLGYTHMQATENFTMLGAKEGSNSTEWVARVSGGITISNDKRGAVTKNQLSTMLAEILKLKTSMEFIQLTLSEKVNKGYVEFNPAVSVS